MATATFAAGCFWQVEAEFRNVPGVTGTAVGYMGGRTSNPTYEQVCTDRTGHAEVVQVEFDPDKVSYAELLDVFWSIHDPTQLNRQGPDFGTQYRSAIFYRGREQEEQTRESLARAQARIPERIVTEVTPAGEFWRAEDYHQQYLEKRGLASCRIPGIVAL
jgi:peptide-methionine (S)-S-oxide reductase